MYNRYIGNTGKYTRVEDNYGGLPYGRRPNAHWASPQAKPPPVHHQAEPNPAVPPSPLLPSPKAPRSGVKGKSPFGGLGSGLANLLGGRGGGSRGLLGGSGGLLGGSGGLLGGLGSGLKGLTGVFDNLPFGLDLGDILLFLMLLFFFLESGDEEFIIILAVIAFSLFKDR